MLNSIQVKLLKKGFHTNTSWRKLFKFPSKAVVVVGENSDGKPTEIRFTPNRRQRRTMAIEKAASAAREVFLATDKGIAQIKARDKRRKTAAEERAAETINRLPTLVPPRAKAA